MIRIFLLGALLGFYRDGISVVFDMPKHGDDLIPEISVPTILPEAERVGLVVNMAEGMMYYYPEPEGSGTTKGVVLVQFNQNQLCQNMEGNGYVIGKYKGTVDKTAKNSMSIQTDKFQIVSQLAENEVEPSNDKKRCFFLPEKGISELFKFIPLGAPVNVVNQPVKFGWKNAELYMEVNSPNPEEGRYKKKIRDLAISGISRIKEKESVRVDMVKVQEAISGELGRAVSVGILEESPKQPRSGADRQVVVQRETPKSEPIQNGVVRITAGGTTGSGFFADKHTVLTNAHVVGTAKVVNMTFSGVNHFSGVVSYKNDSLDFAIIETSFTGKLLSARYTPPSLREPVYTLGYPQGRMIVATSTGTVVDVSECCIVHDALIAGGSSGGPLLDANNNVLGLNTLIYKMPGDKTNVSDRTIAVRMDFIEQQLVNLYKNRRIP